MGRKYFLHTKFKYYFMVFVIWYVFFSRSILLPLRKGETFRFVLPFNWIVLGLTGLLMDIVKIPGRVYGLIRIIGIKIK